MPDFIEARLQQLCVKQQAGRHLGPLFLAVESADGSLRWNFGDRHAPYFIASATKLYVTWLLVRLRLEGKVDWDTPFVQYLPSVDVTGLHIFRNKDFSSRITVRQLMAHTSGLPDYFEGKRTDGPNTFSRLLEKDFSFALSDVLRISKTQQKAHFPPGEKQKALYSDTNYQLLGALIEAQYQMPFADVVLEKIVKPLGLKNTWCFSPSTLEAYDSIAPLRYGKTTLRIPKGMASVQADGGVVSTLADSLVFLRAFFGGSHIPENILNELQTPWRDIFFPLSYGTGVMSFQVPWYFSPFQRFPRVVGHSGASGALMFFCPEWNLLIAGTVNQAKSRSASFQLMIQALALAHSLHATI